MNNDFPTGRPAGDSLEMDRAAPDSASGMSHSPAPSGAPSPGVPEATPYERIKPYLLVDPSPRPGAFSDADILSRGPRSGFEGLPPATQAPASPSIPEQRSPTLAPPPMPAEPMQRVNPPASATYSAPSNPLAPTPEQFNPPPAPQQQVNPPMTYAPAPQAPQLNPPPAPQQHVNPPAPMTYAPAPQAPQLNPPPLQRFNPPPPQTYIPPAPPVAPSAPMPVQPPAPPAPTIQRVNPPSSVTFTTHSTPAPQLPPRPAEPQPAVQQMPSGVVAYGVSQQPAAPVTATPVVSNGPATQTHIASNMDFSDLVDAVFVEVTRQNNSGPRRS